jgi:tyrosinase
MFNEIEDVVSGTVIAAVPTILASLGINLGGLGGSYDESASVTVSAGVAYTSASASAVSSKIVNAGNGTSPAYPTGTASLKGNSTPLRANNGSSYQYTCNIETPRYALNGSYSVFLFNGEPKNPDPTSWTFDENLIGPAGILAQPGMTEKNITVSMGVPLTRTLVYAYTQGKIADLTEDSVDAYLAQNLRWRVAGPQGQSIDPKTIPGFKVEVFASTAAKQKSEDEIPEWSEFVPLKKATKGKLSHVSKILKTIN